MYSISSLSTPSALGAVRTRRSNTGKKIVSSVPCSASTNECKRTVSPIKENVSKLVASGTVAAGFVASAALQATFPEQAQALSIRDPVFGDIEVWQFLVLTAGYFIGIEIYLDRKYDESNKPIMPSIQKKEEDSEEE
jgi:predicted phosphoribosyltransferase